MNIERTFLLFSIISLWAAARWQRQPGYNNMISTILDEIENNKNSIFELSTTSGKNENDISKLLFESLRWDLEKKSYGGLFGWSKFDTDKCRTINSELLILEVKKVTEKTEYGYWHGLVQSLIYSYQQSALSENNFLVLCFILDWGRNAGNELREDEKNFLDQFRDHKIRFARVSMANNKFIEHNLDEDWTTINEGGYPADRRKE
ncbi:MAG: hypothetical protein PVF14_00215 [Desulfobacterales bacterium]|jgi:hypothetical protein